MVQFVLDSPCIQKLTITSTPITLLKATITPYLDSYRSLLLGLLASTLTTSIYLHDSSQ